MTMTPREAERYLLENTSMIYIPGSRISRRKEAIAVLAALIPDEYEVVEPFAQSEHGDYAVCPVNNRGAIDICIPTREMADAICDLRNEGTP